VDVDTLIEEGDVWSSLYREIIAEGEALEGGRG
jgi:hypothetical protein